MPEFIPGLELSRLFYEEAVRPILAGLLPHLRYAAAVVGDGSEVLGFDTEMSADHGWGPRVMLFVGEEDHAHCAAAIGEAMRRRLPPAFRGYPTNFTPPDPDDNGTQLLRAAPAGDMNHRVEVLTWRGFVRDRLAFDTDQAPRAADWLTFPQQKLLSMTGGAVYHDHIGLAELRSRFAWYPRDVWLYLLAAGWARIGQEEHLMGRAGLVGDEIGSALIGARLVRDVMRLCFLMERRYAPYAKWFGTAFARLECGPDLAPVLGQTLRAETWPERQANLARAYEYVARNHNRLGLTPPIPDQVSQFFGRPFLVIWGQRFAEALIGQIRDADVLAIAAQRPIGSVDLFSDNTDLLEDPGRRAAIRRLFG